MTISYFFVEIPAPRSDGIDLERAARTLVAAQSRLSDSSLAVRSLVAGVTSDGGRLVCLVEAEAVEVVRSLVALALLPAGRIREVLHLALPGGTCGPSDGEGPGPVADLAPGADPELFQDVVDAGFHGSLGEE
jgi:hypothetical protein